MLGTLNCRREARELAAAWSIAEVEEIGRRHSRIDGALLPILHEVQSTFGHIPPGAVPAIADLLNLSRAEVHGVITFYHDFKTKPDSRPVIKLCRAEACQARGVEQIAALLDSDERVTVDTVYCLGLCASGPSAMVGDRVFARLDPAHVGRLVNEALT
jgi:formate dehydrogenase subunit gamma